MAPTGPRCVWHWKAPQFTGRHIVDLYTLQKLRPELFDKQQAKYTTTSARKMLLMRNPIPKLNCYWNAAVHTSTVHPQKIHDAKRAAGLPVETVEYFEIPVDKLRAFPVVEWKFPESKWDLILTVVVNAAIFGLSKLPMCGFLARFLLRSQYVDMDFDNWRSLDEVPPTTLKMYELWAAQYKEGKAPQVLTYQGVPHVFVQGAIPIDDLKIIKID